MNNFNYTVPIEQASLKPKMIYKEESSERKKAKPQLSTDVD